MKVKLISAKKLLTPQQVVVLKRFINFLFNELPLKNDCIIEFVKNRQGKMTTGVRKPGNHMQILTNKRMFIDILRTISHEWVHEYQIQKMDIDPKNVVDIGGPEENMANILSGIYIKKFQQSNKDKEKVLYNE